MSGQGRVRRAGCVVLGFGLLVILGSLAIRELGRGGIVERAASMVVTTDGGQAAHSAEIEALREETRRLREERMEARKERILALAERRAREGGRPYQAIRLRNTCREAVAVALRYEDLDEQDVTRGWWEIPPGDTLQTDARTRAAAVWAYAENQRIGRTWDGTGLEGSLSLAVSDEKFDQLAGDPELLRNPRRVSFAKRELGPGSEDALWTFECPAEAPPPRARTESRPAEQGARTP